MDMMLSERYPIERIRDTLVSREEWHPFPKAGERAHWEALPATSRDAYMKLGEEALKQQWPALPATLFLEFVRTGNRTHYQDASIGRRSRLGGLVLAECMEGQGRFIDEIVNGLWAICEESFWGVPAHLTLQKAGRGLPDTAEPVVDLFAAETAALLAWTVYLLGAELDTVSALIRARVGRETDRRILTPCLEGSFYWMGGKGRRVNNWNPWCHSNWLTAVLLLETDTARRVAAVCKIMQGLDNFLACYPPDGGCNEGTSYWNHAAGSLFDGLELLLSATGGAVDVYDEPLIQEMGRYIRRMHIGGSYFVNFADGSAKPPVLGSLLYRYGHRIHDAELTGLGAYRASRERPPAVMPRTALGRLLPELFCESELLSAPAKQPLERDVRLKDTRVMTARDRGGSLEGLYVAAKGGHNGESHNHNDVGNFIVFVNGRPAIVDVGVETYTAKTFSGAGRYTIWTMQSAYHNLPIVNGVMQAHGPEFAGRDVAYSADDRHAQLSLDMAGAYPREADLISWLRTITLNRGSNVRLKEEYAFERPPQQFELVFMTACAVRAEKPGRLVLDKRAGKEVARRPLLAVSYPADLFAHVVEPFDILDAKLQSVWGKQLVRILLRAQKPAQRGMHVVDFTVADEYDSR